jgi:hypothetical protein
MKFGTLVEMVSAAHLTPYVFGDVGEERGGLMFVAPPGHLKTTAIETLEQFPRTLLVSNMTNGKLTDLRESFISGEIKTLGFPDFDMLYKRHGSVSSQLEGTIMGLMGEGFRNPPFKDQRLTTMKARSTIIAGITVKCYEEHLPGWLDNGFARRFLWSQFKVKNPEALEEALVHFKKARLDGDFIFKIPGSRIPYNLNENISRKILYHLRSQPDRKLPLIFAQRLVCVLVWKHGPEQGWNIWQDFAPSLWKDGGLIEIESDGL